MTDEAEKLDSSARWHFQSHRRTRTTRFRRVVCTVQSLPCLFVHASISSLTFRSRGNVSITLHSRRPSPRRGLPSGQERTCHSSSARKVPCCLEYNPRMPWDAVFACMARHAKQFWDNEVRRPAFQFITRGSSPSLLAHMVTVGIAPQNLASAPGQRALPDGGRAGSLPFEGKSRTTK